VPLSTAGPIELAVLAMDRSLSTTRRLWSTGGVSSCYHAATGTPHTRSIQEHHRSIQIVGFLWGEVLLGLLRWVRGRIRNQQVRSSTFLAGPRQRKRNFLSFRIFMRVRVGRNVGYVSSSDESIRAECLITEETLGTSFQWVWIIFARSNTC